MDFLNGIGETVSSLGETLIELLPKSPFYYIDANPEVKQVLRYLNWFFPIDLMIPILEFWLLAIVGYYIFQVILRWVKIIE